MNLNQADNLCCNHLCCLFKYRIKFKNSLMSTRFHHGTCKIHYTHWTKLLMSFYLYPRVRFLCGFHSF
jgi:hypothetical protein